jgi:hypothetical protein
MAENNLFKYIAQSGDTEDTIIKKFNIPQWIDVYDYSENVTYRRKRPIPQRIQSGDVVVIPPQFVIPCKSGEELTISQVGKLLFFDGHMHIQSNNCANLPLQWATLSANTGFRHYHNSIRRGCLPFGPIKRPTRKELADTGSKGIGPILAGRLLPIGRIPTDLVANLYMENLENANLRELDSWIVKRPEDEGKAYNPEEMGKRAKLSKMSAESKEKDNLFLAAYRKCYGISQLIRINCTQTFDLTFAHFWGKYGIPTYFPVANSAGNKLTHFINDFVQAGIAEKEISFPDRIIDGLQNEISYRVELYPNAYTPKALETRAYGIETNVNGFIYNLYAKHIKDKEFSFKKQFELFCRWQDPVLDPNDNMREWFFMHFEGDRATNRALLEHKFVHLVEPVLPEPQDCINEEKWVEDFFKKQLPMSEAAAVNYPLGFLLFYHYDPRCHFSGSDGGKDAHAKHLAFQIVSNHAFYTCQREPFRNERFKDNHQYSKLNIEGRIVVTPATDLNSSSYWQELLQQHLHSNNEVFNRLWQLSTDNIYWGIKVYPRLGYSPANFIDYPHLKDVYAKCIQKEIPVLSHCSEGGMAIADYYNYIRYELDLNKPPDLAPDEYDLAGADNRFTDNYAAPANWKAVLDTPGLSNLKICLAHFGGYPTWRELGLFKDIEKLMTNPKPSKDESKKIHRYKHWILSIAEMINNSQYPNVYTDLACFTFGFSPLHPFRDEIYNCSHNLVFLLEKYKNLKEHLLIGTDWPMVESNPSALEEKDVGMGLYMDRMMTVLREVSRQVGYDAWHQFSYINQLKYLGLLSGNGTEKKVDIKKLKDYRDRLIVLLNKGKRWHGFAYKKDGVTSDSILSSTNPIINAIEKMPKVMAAEDQKLNGALKILNYEGFDEASTNYSTVNPGIMF